MVFAETSLEWIPVWMAGIALAVAFVSLLGNVLNAVMQIMSKRSSDALTIKIDDAAVKREELSKSSETKIEKVISDVKEIHTATNSLADKTAAVAEKAIAESKLAGIQMGINQERERVMTESGVLARGALNVIGDKTTTGNGTVETNVADVKETVEVIDKNVGDIKGEVLKDVKAGVAEAVKNVKNK